MSCKTCKFIDVASCMIDRKTVVKIVFNKFDFSVGYEKKCNLYVEGESIAKRKEL